MGKARSRPADNAELIAALAVPPDDPIRRPRDEAVSRALEQRYEWQIKQFRSAAEEVYAELFPWWRPALSRAATWTGHDAQAERECWKRADKEWVQLTGLPGLDEFQGRGWNAAATAAGIPEAVKKIPSQRTIEVVLAWALVKRAEQNQAHAPDPPSPRIVLGGDNVVVLDGRSIAVKPNGYKLFTLLLELPPGDYLSISENGLRTRDVQSLPTELLDAVESDPGAGTRIRREYLA